MRNVRHSEIRQPNNGNKRDQCGSWTQTNEQATPSKAYEPNRRSLSKRRTRAKSSRKKFRCKNVGVAAHDARTYMKVHINGQPVRLQLDTGADITMISRKTWNKIGSPALSPGITAVKTADGSPMSIQGCFETDFTIFDRHHNPASGRGNCYVTEATDLLGLEWCIQMPDYRQLKDQYNCQQAAVALDNNRHELVAHLRTKFTNVFTPGLGRCTKTKAKLFLKPDAQPVYRQKRPVPFASQPAVNAEIDRLLQEGVLTAVDHSNWAAPIVVVKKSNGSIRLCADFSTGLNDSLSLHQHPLPTTEEVFTKLNGGQLFSQIDLADAYLQIEVEEDSKELLTINTHRGLFRYNRLPFGVKSAPGIFQQIIDSMIAGLDGVAAYLDDIIVTGRTTVEHRHNLEALLRRIEQYGFRVREEKCHFMMPEIRYLGNIIDANGRRPDPDKIQAITKMPRSNDIAQLRSFLGMLNYYGTFIAEMRQLRASLDALLKKNAPFKWSQECQNAFERAKDILTSPLLLTHYDPKLDLIVAADASDYGIGAVILHRFADGSEKAISHASRSLTETEKKYGQIEKEGLALVYAVRKFHRYLLGRKFTLLTDHKPLVSIFGSKKGLPAYTANRLLRWSLILRGYDFKIEYRKTTDFGQADALSRLIAEQTEQAEDIVIANASNDADYECKAIEAKVPIDMKQIAEETLKDETLKDVIQYVKEDKWPKKPQPKIKCYFALRQSLSLQDDCLFFGPRIIIPSKFHDRVLSLLHDGHPGMSRMKSLARCYVYWTNITKDIENFVRSCSNCQEVAKTPVKTELFSWPKEEKLWSRIHVDFAGPINGKMFLIIVDAYSKWPEVIEMSSTTSKATIRQLSKLFAQFGCPETLVSDNGSQFTSLEFTEFCKKSGVVHIRSPPYHPQSNGQAEFVDTFKRAMEKMKNSEQMTEAVQKFLMTYRSTPCESSPKGLSPAENLLGHRIRTPLTQLAMPRHSAGDRNEDMEKQFNRHHGARSKSFEPEDAVWIKNFKGGKSKWIPGKVLLRHGNALYDVTVGETVERRHANQMLPRLSDKTFSDLDLPEDGPSRDQEKDTSNPAETPIGTNPLDGRPQRIRRPPSRLQIKPTQKSYL
ncbi:integrase core domain protein [Teladorsagia circumcincta]|uniref:RNA-directed DNA polymerase n=1 Tax=Teladorsagia circumcincta TaxID=45464 RepID=A0A2G9TS33_TELCI|nr:integrase core domain protein [Teladorsagia circumcincta]